MDFIKRQEAPTEVKEINTQRTNFKLQLRTKSIQEIIWSKRNPSQCIRGYDHSLRRRNHKKKQKKCWVCGSPDHLKAHCPVHKQSQLSQRVTELEKRIQELEELLHIQNKMKKKRDQKKRRKIKKKKKKKHQRLVKALNMAVKIKGLILQEETTWEGIHALKAAKYIENMSNRAKEATFKAYKGLYGTDLPVDMASAFCDGDEFFEYIESEPPPINFEKINKLMAGNN